MQKSIFQFTLKPPEQCAFPGGNPFRISWFYAGTFLIGRDTRRKDFFYIRLRPPNPEKPPPFPGNRYGTHWKERKLHFNV